MVLFAWGKENLPLENVKYGIACDSLAMEIGLRDGDKILSVDNKFVDGLNRVPAAIILDQAKSIQVERDGQKIDIPISEDQISKLIQSQKRSPFIVARFPAEIDSIKPGFTAEKAGLQKEDLIIAINDSATPYFQDVAKYLHFNKGKEVAFTIVRAGDTLKKNVFVHKDSLTGFIPNDEKYLAYKKTSYGFFESFGAGVKEGADKLNMQVKQFSVLFTVKDAYKSLGGFYSLGQVFDPGWDWQVFWTFTAFLSIVLAFMNILPIPALDGGHVMFLIYELITRRKPNEKVMEYAQYVGMILLLGLMVYANSDWLRR
jgi:regulator of sigma E protease